MWIAVLAGLVCLVTSVIMFTPGFRGVPLFRPVGMFFFFEGAWVLANYIVVSIQPTTDIMAWIHYIGILILSGYLLICLLVSRPQKEQEKERGKDRNNARNNTRNSAKGSARNGSPRNNSKRQRRS